ncbi:hypothetical protein GF312_01080 [Candidatus Poribacteria bacterium]|nr:hypothetical protein [Candidatus Poribacteria bacterium]
MVLAEEIVHIDESTFVEVYPFLSGLSGYREPSGFGVPVKGTPVPYSFSWDFTAGSQGVRVYFTVYEYDSSGEIDVTAGIATRIDECRRKPESGKCFD